MTSTNFNSLNLTFKESILDGILLKEKIDIDLLDKLINSNLLKETFNNPMSKIYKTEKHQLQKYRELITDGYANVKYERVKDMNCGRSNPNKSLGLFSIRREIRQTLTKNNYIDIDIDNCHPVVLNEILKQNNITNKYLQSYVDNRQKWFDNVNKHYHIGKICNNDPIKMKEIPKNLFIRIMYGGGLKSWMKEYNIKDVEPFLKLNKFITHINLNMEMIMHKNKELTELIVKRKESQNKTDYNLKGSVCSYYLQTKEADILEKLFLYLKSKSLINNDSVILCADGLMMEKEYYNESLLNTFEALIKKQFNIDVKFSEKEMTQDYLEILDNNLDFILYNEEMTTGLLSSHFKIMFGNQFMVYEDRLYKYNGVFWKYDDSKKSTTLHSFLSSTFYNYMVKYCIKIKTMLFEKLQLENNDDSKNNIKLQLTNLTTFEKKVNVYCNNVSSRNNLVEDIRHHITKTNIKLDNKPYLFAFNNKIYDLKLGKFIIGNPNDYLTISTNYDYDDYYDLDNLTYLKEEYLKTIFTNEDVLNYYLSVLSTGLYGERIENLFISTGKGGNGKSALDSLMMSCIGNYGYKIPSSLLLQPIKEGANPAVANIHKKRFCLSQEPDKTKKICTSTMKELTGDSTINSRSLYSDNCKVELNLTLVLECNELPKMDEVNDAIIRRTRVIPFNSKFVDQNTYNTLDKQEIEDNNIFPGSNHFISTEFQNQYKQGLIMILFEQFKKYVSNDFKLGKVPDMCSDACNDYLALSDNIYDWFTNTFEKTDDNSSVLYYQDIFDIFSSSNYYQNLNKNEKRENNLKSFSNKLEQCVFLTKNLRKRDSTYGGIKHKKPYIIGFKLQECEEVVVDSALDA